jgi:hypothetical protein
MKHPMHFQIITFEGRGAYENYMFYPQWKTFDQSNSLGKLVKCLCDPLSRWEELNSRLPPEILKPKCAYYNGLATLPNVCEMSHISNYVYVENSL